MDINVGYSKKKTIKMETLIMVAIYLTYRFSNGKLHILVGKYMKVRLRIIVQIGMASLFIKEA